MILNNGKVKWNIRNYFCIFVTWNNRSISDFTLHHTWSTWHLIQPLWIPNYQVGMHTYVFSTNERSLSWGVTGWYLHALVLNSLPTNDMCRTSHCMSKKKVSKWSKIICVIKQRLLTDFFFFNYRFIRNSNKIHLECISELTSYHFVFSHWNSSQMD